MKIFENQHYISSDPQLYTMFYRPEHGNGRAILMVPPSFEEKKSVQRIWVYIAKTLAYSGFDVLMFDLGGCGDSQLGEKYVSISAWLKDINTATKYLLENSSATTIILIGLRLGGYLSMLYYSKTLYSINCLILIEPVLKPYTYFYQILRNCLIKDLLTNKKISMNRQDLLHQLETMHEIDFSGFRITNAFYKELLEFEKVIDVAEHLNDQCITIIHAIWQGGGLAKKKKIKIQYSNCRHQFVEILPFWERIDVDIDPQSISKEIMFAIYHAPNIIHKS